MSREDAPIARRKPFSWQPGCGYSKTAAARLAAHFQKPADIMGEAWFMGDTRRMFPALNGDLSAVGVRELQDAFEQIYSGVPAFGRHSEWVDWYHYLMPRLLHRHAEAFGDSLNEYLIGAFFVLHPGGISDEATYRGFREDCLATLGHLIMDETFWDQGQVRIGASLHRSNNNPARYWGWEKASGDFSASAFFCAKYLRPDEIEPWLTSMLAIRSAPWVAQVMVWLLGAHGVFTGDIKQPIDFIDRPDVSWAWSHVIRGDAHDGVTPQTFDFIPHANRAEILRILDKRLTLDLFFEWLELIKQHPEIEVELQELPSQFADAYQIGT